MNTGKRGKRVSSKPDCGHCPRLKESSKAEPTELVDKVLGEIEKKIDGGDYKTTVGDLLRLLQYKAESKQERQPKEIKVTWVEPKATSETDE